MCIQETKITSTTTKIPKIKEYDTTYQKQRTNGKAGGGLAIYVHNSFPNTTHIDLLDNINNEHIEIQGIDIKMHQKTTALYNIYDPPGHKQSNKHPMLCTMDPRDTVYTVRRLQCTPPTLGRFTH